MSEEKPFKNGVKNTIEVPDVVDKDHPVLGNKHENGARIDYIPEIPESPFPNMWQLVLTPDCYEDVFTTTVLNRSNQDTFQRIPSYDSNRRGPLLDLYICSLGLICVMCLLAVLVYITVRYYL